MSAEPKLLAPGPLAGGGFIGSEYGWPAAGEEAIHGGLSRCGRRLYEPPAEELHRRRQGAVVKVDAVPERREHALALGLGGSLAVRMAADAIRRRPREAILEPSGAQRRVPRAEPPCDGATGRPAALALGRVAAAGERARLISGPASEDGQRLLVRRLRADGSEHAGPVLARGTELADELLHALIPHP